LGFIFDRNLSFHQHISFYSNKALSTIKSMKMLENSTRGLLPYQKQFFYKMCILLIVLYKFSLWFFNKALLLHSLKELRKIQCRATIWITIHIVPLWDIKAISSLISIHFYFQKLSSRHYLRVLSLLSNHTINTLLENRHVKNSSSHHLFFFFFKLTIYYTEHEGRPW